MSQKVLISGASIAGPALAHWLGEYGFDVTVVEIAPALREGGQAVDFRGATHLTVLERMGILDELRRLRTGGSPMRFVDETGRLRLELPADWLHEWLHPEPGKPVSFVEVGYAIAHGSGACHPVGCARRKPPGH